MWEKALPSPSQCCGVPNGGRDSPNLCGKTLKTSSRAPLRDIKQCGIRADCRLHLLRRFASNGQMLVMARELKAIGDTSTTACCEAMKDAKVSHLEVVEFRQVFNQLAIEAKTEKKPEPVAPAGRRRSMADLSRLESRVKRELPRDSMVALAASTRLPGMSPSLGGQASLHAISLSRFGLGAGWTACLSRDLSIDLG